MTLKEYAKQVQHFAELYPDAQVIYAIDDEGNAFHPVHGGCGGMVYYNERDHALYDKEEMIDTEPNAFCVN